MRVDGAFGFPRRHAADDVADGQAARALFARFAKRGQRVGGFARLRDDDDERVAIDDEVAIAVLGAVVDFDRQAGEPLDEEFAHQRRVPRRAAGDERDLVDAAQVGVGDTNLFEEHRPVSMLRAAEQRLFGRARLLEDLLEHEMAVAGLLRHDRVPHHPLCRLRDRRAGEVRELDAVARDDGHLFVAEKHHVARVAENGRRVGRDEELVVAKPDDDRRPVAHRDDFFRVVGRDATKAKSPRIVQQRSPRGLLELVVGPPFPARSGAR